MKAKRERGGKVMYNKKERKSDVTKKEAHNYMALEKKAGKSKYEWKVK